MRRACSRLLRPSRWVPAWALLAAILVLGVPGGPAYASPEDDAPGGDAAGDEAAKGEEAETSPLTVPEKAVARKLNDALKKAAKKKKAPQVVPAMEAIEELDHPEFHKILYKLLKHVSSLVSFKAAEMWEWRVHDKKVAARLWKASWLEKANKRRYLVKAKTLKAFARAGHVLDAKQFKEIERTWRWITGNPKKANAAALADIAEYFELTMDKRMCKQFAMELDDPCANVNAADPAAMPMDWQEKRWKLWNESKPAIVSALKALTGQEFDSTKEAKAWFRANEKTFGVRW